MAENEEIENIRKAKSIIESNRIEGLQKLERWLITASFLMLNMAIMLAVAEIAVKFLAFAGLWFVGAFFIWMVTDNTKEKISDKSIPITDNRRTIKDYPQFKS